MREEEKENRIGVHPSTFPGKDGFSYLFIVQLFHAPQTGSDDVLLDGVILLGFDDGCGDRFVASILLGRSSGILDNME